MFFRLRIAAPILALLAVALSAPAQAGAPVDVYLVAGQSNAQGFGDSTQAPVPPHGTVLQFYNGAITDAVDPVGNANTGSAWPAFGIAYFNANASRKILFVPAAVATSAQVAAADSGSGNWDAGSPFLTTAMNAADAAMTALSQAGYIPVFKGVLWSQGERDGFAIDNNTTGVSQGSYEAALRNMIATFRAHYGSTMPFFIFKTGTQTNASDAGFAAIRDAQEDVGASDPYSFIAFRGAYDFWWRGEMGNIVHYTQAGYNQMGTQGAGMVSWFRAHPASPKSPAAFPGTGAYPGTVAVTLSSAGSTSMVYTLDGSAPDCAAMSQRYVAPIAISNTAPIILLASGCRTGIASPVANYTYNYTAQSPIVPSASPAPGTYALGVTVTLAAANATSIRYIWSSNPAALVCRGGTLYTGPIALSQSHNSLRAIACNGAHASAAQTFTYTITK